LAGVYAACAASVLRDDGQHIDWQAARTDSAGRYRIEDVNAELPHALFLQRDGLATVVFELGVPSAGMEVPDIVLRPGVSVFGRVVDPAGAPRAGVDVELRGANADRATRFGHPLESFLDTYVAERAMRTDAAGRFAFVDVADGDHTVSARLRGLRVGEERPCAVAGAPVDLGRIELAAGLSIEGRAVDPEGRGAGGVYVNAWREDGRGQGLDVITRVDGTFILAGLEEGIYRLELVPFEAREGARLARSRVEAVPAGTSGLEVPLAESSPLKGRVLDAAGKPVPNASIELFVTGEPGGMEQSDADGRFAFYPPRSATLALVAHPEKAGAEPNKPFQYDPDPARAARLEVVDPERGEVVLVLPGPP
jgi:protocatechuate 3,4-dioxygenase beta subunit